METRSYWDRPRAAGKAATTENYAYIGMFWTWGKDDKKNSASLNWMHVPMNGKGLE
jgi:hypothetical protein